MLLYSEGSVSAHHCTEDGWKWGDVVPAENSEYYRYDSHPSPLYVEDTDWTAVSRKVGATENRDSALPSLPLTLLCLPPSVRVGQEPTFSVLQHIGKREKIA